MDIQVERIWLAKTFTIAEWYFYNKYVCDSVEDQVRESGKKVQDETAIPAGKYKVVLSYSPKFKQITPEILNVPGFTGIRIHWGNSSKDTSGCPIVGYWDGDIDWVKDSKKAYKIVYDEIESAINNGEEVTITFNNAPKPLKTN